MDPIPNLPPRKLKSHPSLQIQIPNHDTFLDGDDENEDCICNKEIFYSDEFRMYEFKVRLCGRARSHDWTDCPWAHPGEKAARRDPREHCYSAAVCPDYKSRGGSCPRGENCGFAHGVFERWLHPARYRTTPCRDGKGCRRKVCFFAHTKEQLRVLSPCSASVFLSPTSTLLGSGGGGCSESPPLSPMPEVVSRLQGMEIGPDLEWVDELLE